MDRTRASEARNAGSIPAEGTNERGEIWTLGKRKFICFCQESNGGALFFQQKK